MTLVLGYQGRRVVRDIVVRDSASAAITPGANDHVRAIVSRDGQAAALTVASNAASANGSTFVRNTSSGTNRLTIVAADMTALAAGTWNLEISYYDNAQAEWQTVERQVFQVVQL